MCRHGIFSWRQRSREATLVILLMILGVAASARTVFPDEQLLELDRIFLCAIDGAEANSGIARLKAVLLDPKIEDRYRMYALRRLVDLIRARSLWGESTDLLRLSLISPRKPGLRPLLSELSLGHSKVILAQITDEGGRRDFLRSRLWAKTPEHPIPVVRLWAARALCGFPLDRSVREEVEEVLREYLIDSLEDDLDLCQRKQNLLARRGDRSQAVVEELEKTKIGEDLVMTLWLLRIVFEDLDTSHRKAALNHGLGGEEAFGVEFGSPSIAIFFSQTDWLFEPRKEGRRADLRTVSDRLVYLALKASDHPGFTPCSGSQEVPSNAR